MLPETVAEVVRPWVKRFQISKRMLKRDGQENGTAHYGV
jgi:hypothetical protein